ncbi:MAG: septum formation initiator family protein [Dehalococcoidia bacterium]|nr:septum formation initiator family protein [Dehalococcoidia bacterium]
MWPLPRLSLAFPVQGVTVLMFIALAIYLLMAAGQRTAQIIQLSDSHTRLSREVRFLDEEFTRLKAERDRLQSTIDIERVAREELNLIKPGETAVIVIASPRGSEAKQAPAAEATEPAPPWRQWWGWMFGN